MTLPISKLRNNTGQITGVPKNPRFIRDERYAKLKANIEAYPEFLNLRELLVFQQGGIYVVICGNMRLRAMKELGEKDAPVKVIPPETTPEQLRAYAIIDNVGFGQDDTDALKVEWNVQELTAWGVELPVWDVGETEATNGEKSGGNLAEKFIIPPFSVFDTRQGYWQDRKRAWLGLGIQSELGRGGGVTYGQSPQITETGLNYYRNQTLGAIPPNQKQLYARMRHG